MTVDERRRSGLYQVVAEAFGQEHAMTMFELLPPPSTDLAIQQDVDRRFDAVDLRFEAIDQRFDAIEQRFDAIDQRFGTLDQRLGARFGELRGELLAAFRGELVTAVAGQTWALMLAVVTTTVAVGGMAIALAQLL